MQCTLDSKGDHILAARFLSRFVPKDVAWAHIDLSSSERKGGLAHVPTEITGFGVRFAAHLLGMAPSSSNWVPQVSSLRMRRPTTGTAPAGRRAPGGRTAIHRGSLRARTRDAEPEAAMTTTAALADYRAASCAHCRRA